MVNPKDVAIFCPPGLKKFKLNLFEGIGRKIQEAGGRVVRHDYEAIKALPDEIIPIIGVSPQFRQTFAEWKLRKRSFIAWDRGYLRRVFATWMPTGNELGIPMGFYRWHLNCFQQQHIMTVPGDRWRALRLDRDDPSVGVRKAFPWPWKREGKQIVVCDTLPDYWDVFADRDWASRTAQELRHYTDRPIIVRHKESQLPLWKEIEGAHALVTHGSIAAVESVCMGCPVFVDRISAAAVMGETDFSKIETPRYPENRLEWLYSLAYHQWTELELVDGTLWRQLT